MSTNICAQNSDSNLGTIHSNYIDAIALQSKYRPVLLPNAQFHSEKLTDESSALVNISIDFEESGTGTPLLVGEVITNEYANFGINISSRYANGTLNTNNPLVIFDSSSPQYGVVYGNGDPSNGDCDLGTPAFHCSSNSTDGFDDCGGSYPGESNEGAGQNNCAPLGNVLIVEEHFVDANNDQRDDSPDDLGSGGIIRFDFDEPFDLNALGIVDDAQGELRFTYSNGTNGVVPINSVQDNDTLMINLNEQFVIQLDVVFSTSGAVSFIGGSTSLCNPMITCPADITVFSLDGNPVNVNDIGNATGSSSCSNVTISNNAPGSNNYPVGSNQVTWTVQDNYGNSISCNQEILVQELASLGNFVFLDEDADGIQDFGENGISGVTVNLLDENDIQIAEVITNGSGAYSFTDLVPGNYSVNFEYPSGYEGSPQNQSGEAVDSDANPSTGTTGTITLTSGEDNEDVDAGLYQLASLGDLVFLDEDADGIQDSGENGISGVTVNLLDENDIQIAEAITNGSGVYGFTNLVPGDYSVNFEYPSGYEGSPQDQGSDEAVDSDANPSTGTTGTITLTSGENNEDVDAGLYEPASLGDVVFLDEDADGIQDSGENGISGVTVNLLDENDIQIAEAITNGSGVYSFANLVPGDYSVNFEYPSGYEASPQDQGSDEAVDSDANPSTGTTGTITLISGENNEDVDAGLYQLASLGDLVFLDEDADGIQDSGENGISGVTVNLLDENDIQIAEAITNGSGVYGFTNLVPGDYSVNFEYPTGYEGSPQDQGSNEAVDSDANPSTGTTGTITLISGENNEDIDAGLYELASLGDLVFLDEDADGIQDSGESGVSGVTVNLLDENDIQIAEVVTNGSGVYGFTNLVPGEYSVNFEYPTGYQGSPQDQGSDEAVDSDANPSTGTTGTISLTSGENNEDIDAGIYELAGLGDVVFLDEDADGIQDSGENGISGVTVNLLDENDIQIAEVITNGSGAYSFINLVAGNYSVNFEYPTGYQGSPQDQGSDEAVDSDANPSTGTTGTISLTSGEYNPNVDAGIYELASLGDVVFLDEDADGIQDLAENGVSGVTVNLLDENDIQIAEAITDGSGVYGFTNLIPGDYSVNFEYPTGYEASPQDQGSNEAVDSDANPSTGTTGMITLISGEDNPNVDAGIYELASLGDLVFFDEDADGIQDSGENGISGVTVNLLDENDIQIAEAITNGSGVYGFANLVPGDYSVNFEYPTGHQGSPQDQGSDEAQDSDANPSTGTTGTITLTSGEDNPNIDAGLFQFASLGNYVWADENADGVQDVNEDGINNVKVFLYDALDLTTPLDSTLTYMDMNFGDGYYQFDLLLSGAYVIRFDTISGMVRTTIDNSPNGDADDSDPNAVTGFTAPIALLPGENNPDIDAGYYEPASVGNTVWNDLNGNGILDATEFGIPGVAVVITDDMSNPVFDITGNLVDTVYTNVMGMYNIDSLIPGDYIITFVSPSGYITTTANVDGQDTDMTDVDNDSDAADLGMSHVINLTSGEANNNIDAGYFQPASLGNYVWYDANNNGHQEAGENGINGIFVKLYEDKDMDGLVDGPAIDSMTTAFNATTSQDGYYVFDSLPSGTYLVEFDTDIYSVTEPDAVNDALDSDVNPTTGFTDLINLAPGENDMTIDAGFIEFAALGNRVWIDAPNGIDDVFDPMDTPFENVNVSLFRSDNLNDPIHTTMTDANGYYLFDSLAAGQYVVLFEEASPYIFVGQDAGTLDSIDSDAGVDGFTGIIVLTSGQIDTTIDAGLRLPPVPVELLYFRGEHNTERLENTLEWKVATEIGVYKYEIQRLDAYGNWIKIAEQEAVGVSQSTFIYSDVDRNIESNNNYYYRLRILDLDGVENYSKIISIKSSDSDFDIRIYPNPARTYINIDISEAGEYNLEIRDLTGRKIIDTNLKQVDISHLPSGYYVLRVIKDQKLITKKFEKID